MPLIIILAECGLELIPKEIRTHPAVKRHLSIKNYSSQLLDNALHHSAMKKLKNKEKRGRPDITHISLLNILGSSLSKSGNLKLFVHTIHNKIYEINHEIRIARNFNRFKGLIAKLLIDGNIIVDNVPLITRFKRNLDELIKSIEKPEIIIFSSRGKIINNYHDLFLNDLSRNNIAIVGGFQKSNFSEKVLALSDNLVSISKYQLDAWIVVNKVINYYEITHNIL